VNSLGVKQIVIRVCIEYFECLSALTMLCIVSVSVAAMSS
jgi:hypothetical protein